MQGNTFLGAFFRVSPFLKFNGISEELFLSTVKKQYVKKFGRFGDAVVASNMKVMEDGLSRVQEIRYGEIEDPDRSSMRNPPLRPNEKFEFIPTAGCGNGSGGIALPGGQVRAPFQTTAKFDSEFRCGLGYHQPASALASAGILAAGSGATQSKYVARRETPVYIAENCTQCMECITACPDTALPNTAQEIGVVLSTMARYYVKDAAERDKLTAELKGVESRARAQMVSAIEKKEKRPFNEVIRTEVHALPNISDQAKTEFYTILDQVPLAYTAVAAIFRNAEKKTPGAGGLFGIFVSDLCKGCGECVQV